MIDFSQEYGVVRHAQELDLDPLETYDRTARYLNYETAVWHVWDQTKPLMLYLTMTTCRLHTADGKRYSTGIRKMDHFTKRTHVDAGHLGESMAKQKYGGYVNLGLVDCVTRLGVPASYENAIKHPYLVSELARELMQLMFVSCHTIVAAWGNKGSPNFFQNTSWVAERLIYPIPNGIPMLCLGTNESRSPRFPGHCSGSVMFSLYWQGAEYSSTEDYREGSASRLQWL